MEEKEVKFEDLELVIDAPCLSEETNVPMAGSNFEAMSKKIKMLVAKYGKTELTEENVNYVTTLKSHFVSLRTGIEAKRKEWKKIYISPMETTIDSVCKDLTALVSEGEMALKTQLDAYDQKRKDQLTEVLNMYKADSAEGHHLREEFAQLIELKPKYYNKTQKEEDSMDDIEAQAVELEKKQTEYDNSVALIKAECEGTTLVVDNYIDQLKYKSPMELILQIKLDKKKAQALYEEMKAKEASGEKIVIGEKAPDELSAALYENEKAEGEEEKSEKRERILRVRYLPSQAKLMADFFRKNRIEFEFIKE